MNAKRLRMMMIVSPLLIASPAAAETSQVSVGETRSATEITDTRTDAAVCVWNHCLSKRQLAVGGLVAGGAAAGAAAVGHAAGPEAAMATAGGAAYFYGPQAWEWLGFTPEGAVTTTVPTPSNSP